MTENEKKEAKTLIYQEVCNLYRTVDDFRTKVLSFLPLVSGGVFLLLGEKVDSNRIENVKFYLSAIGIFGFVITVGLMAYEIRALQRCITLSLLGRKIEKELNVTGFFRYRIDDIENEFEIGKQKQLNKQGKDRRKLFYLSTKESGRLASRIIYSSMLSAWLFVAIVGHSLIGGIVISIVGFIVVFLILMFFSSQVDKGIGVLKTYKTQELSLSFLQKLTFYLLHRLFF